MQEDGHGDEKIKLMNMLVEELSKDEITKPPNLRHVDRKKIKEKTAEVDKILGYVQVNTLEEIDNLTKTAGNLVAKLLRVKVHIRREKKEPWWMRRIKGQINAIRKDISKLHDMKDGKLKKIEVIERLKKQYNLKRKGINLVLEELRQRVTAKTAKIKRYESRIDQFNQNRMF